MQRINKINVQVIQEVILKDEYLRQLHLQKLKVYQAITPKAVLRGDKYEIMPIDENDYPILLKINELIGHRIEQIKGFYIKSLDNTKQT